jgi:thymidylate synthase
MENHPEKQYLQLIKDIIEKGTEEEGRNGSVKFIFGYLMKFPLRDGELPLLTTKRLAWKTCFKELQWFIKGSTNNKELKNVNVHIWDENSTREFLDNRNLMNLEEDDIGPGYGHQWRHFNAPYVNCNTDYTGQGIDQLMYIINKLKDPKERTSRRLIMTAWNPCQIEEMALPPCHVLAQFNVRDNKYLSCALYQRSGDVGLGVPFNIASYSFLTHIIASHCDLIADEFVYFLGNAHIYTEHLEALKTQIEREPLSFPKISIKKQENIEDYSLEHIEWLEDYKHLSEIKMNMKA